MSRSRGSGRRARVLPAAVLAGLPAALLALTLGGCPLVSFDPLAVSVWPEEANAILPPGSSPWVQFPSEPDRASVQHLFTLASPAGSVSGDFRWDGLRMYFDPAPALAPGVRYVSRFRGRVTLASGESFDASREVPFYVLHAHGGPLLASTVPSDGGVAGTTTPLLLLFSGPVDAASFAREFVLEPWTDTITSWSASGQEVTVAPRDAWRTLTTYSWTVGKALAAPDGSPAGLEYAGRFRVQLDSAPPSVVSVLPGLRPAFTPTGNPLSQTGADDVLLLTFSEDVSEDSLSSAFVLSPATKGTLLRVSSEPPVFAFVPDGRFLMGQGYTLQIGTALADLSGNKLPAAFETAFTPAIPLQCVRSIQALNAPAPDTWTVFNTPDAKLISIDLEGTVTLVITFAEAFTVDARIRLLEGVVFDAYFPASLEAPSLVSASWSNGDRLTLTYAGLERSEPASSHYYKLTLPGGAAASDNGSGSFLKDDVWLYLLAEE